MSKVQGAPVLKVKRYSVLGPSIVPNIVQEADGEYVKATEVKAAIRQMAKSHRLTPETATRIIESLAL